MFKKTQSIQQLIKEIIHQLLSIHADIHHAQIVAWWMLEAITKKNKLALLVNAEITLTPDQQKLLALWIKKHVNEHYPLQYLLGSIAFAGLTIIVEPPTLIPRPETEEWVMSLIQKLQTVGDVPLTILDMCTGSGCIGLALAKALPQSHVYAVDIADSALVLAQKNAQNNQIFNITFLKSDLFTQLPSGINFDLIISNPPYIDQAEWESLEPVVTRWEDKQALVADDNGLDLLKKIINQAPNYLNLKSILMSYKIPNLTVEIGHQQGVMVKNIFMVACYKNVTICKDSNGVDRTVSGYL